MTNLQTDRTREELEKSEKAQKAEKAEKARVARGEVGVEQYETVPLEPELDYEIKRRLPELAPDFPAKIIATGTLDEATKLALTLSGSDRGSMNIWHAVLPEGAVVESVSVSSRLRLEQSQGLFVEPVEPLGDPLARAKETTEARQEREARERAKGQPVRREPIP